MLQQFNLLAISGSLRSGSSNHNILKYLGSIIPANINYTIYNGLAQIPAFDPGLDTEDAPASVTELRHLLANADGIVICTPEYAFGVPGSLKNMLDWLVSSSSLVDKPVALITASLGGEHAHASLLLTLGALSVKVVDGATLVISFIRSKMGADGSIADKQTQNSVDAAFKAFLMAIE
ncbi:NADPH-dependent FMN reductase [Mucilaginibacter sp. SP1R1]|uniref:NADPH-dependent FMN reductase n=1 Tax=Mucilaginibacter sp. SP1R1 TaxID=2723091 RepID=UPI00161FD01E|nr:NADPH-dependent FMN reductase [Mucilaginibacter sp. SP1R1]MBB6148762.1 NAD(P)H-dependent FMN reductase [Mucilaginibacter sp. SP1R1]